MRTIMTVEIYDMEANHSLTVGEVKERRKRIQRIIERAIREALDGEEEAFGMTNENGEVFTPSEREAVTNEPDPRD